MMTDYTDEGEDPNDTIDAPGGEEPLAHTSGPIQREDETVIGQAVESGSDAGAQTEPGGAIGDL